MDDWGFLSGLRNPSPGYFMPDHNGHLTPLHKLIYYIQLLIFGTIAGAHKLLNTVFLALGAYAVYRLVGELHTPGTAWITAIAVTLHPMMSGHVLWGGQQGVTFHILFQVLAIHAFLRWTRHHRRQDLLLAATCTVVQNCMFGNGLFLPLLLAFGIVLFHNGQHTVWHTATAFTLLFLAFAAIRITGGRNRTEDVISELSIPKIVVAITHMAGLDGARHFFTRETVIGAATTVVAMVILVGCMVMALLRSGDQQRIGLFLIAWFFIDLITIPLAMGEEVVIRGTHYYYSALCTAPMILIVAHAVQSRPWWGLLPPPIRGISLGVGLRSLPAGPAADQYLFVPRFPNQQQMIKALESGTDYHAFDDPLFAAPSPPVLDPTGIYRHWCGRDLFRLRLGSSHAPASRMCDPQPGRDR